MLRRIGGITAVVLLCTGQMWAGALRLELGNPANDQEALAKGAVLIARTTACHKPEDTTMTATAEGVLEGKPESIPLKLTRLSTSGSFAVAKEWPPAELWAVKVVARNPEYRNYATGMVVLIKSGSVVWESAQFYSHEPTASEVASVLNGHANSERASLQ